MPSPKKNVHNEDISKFPLRDNFGNVTTVYDEYIDVLNLCTRKMPLFEACQASGIKVAKTANLEKLRKTLINHWYPGWPVIEPLTKASPYAPQPLPSLARTAQASIHNTSETDEVELLLQYEVDGAGEDILGFDDDEDLDSEVGEEDIGNAVDDYGDISEPEEDIENDDETSAGTRETDFSEFQRRVRVAETRRSEANRRIGGVKTQKAIVKAWTEFVAIFLKRGEIIDEIIDEHHILMWIKYCSERPKKNRKSIDIPGTFLGASHIKKLYFGVLRIRKEQDAEDPSLIYSRPATSHVVWDSLKSRMREAMERSRNGDIPGEDAPDIVANTFLAGVTEEQVDAIGDGFLNHSHLRSAINGHLAWTGQNASGNRGDDFRALKLCELQPHVFLHPNGETGIQTILALQGEEKAAGGRGMKTKVNPVYTSFITHMYAERCPLGALAFYHHYLHDVITISDKCEIDWSVNKSWRKIRLLHGPKSPTTPYSEQNLYNLYVKAFEKAGFNSGIKAHLPRHILGYRQEKLGVDPLTISKLGWVRGETYFDTYAPSLPKAAILGAHGFKEHETYDPVWRHVHIPEAFLTLVCPMAEEIHAEIVGRENLTGAANYWNMVIFLRKYVFLCGAAIFQRSPDATIFRLPALANSAVRHWMKTEYPTNLALLRAAEQSPVDLQRIQNESLRLALEEVRSLLIEQRTLMRAVKGSIGTIERRTGILSPAKTYTMELSHRRFDAATRQPSPIAQPYFGADIDDQRPQICAQEMQPLVAEIDNTQADMILPHPLAFTHPDQPSLYWPPILGQRSVPWDKVYPLIVKPHLLWDCWGPRTLDTYKSVQDLWIAYNTGETVVDDKGVPTGIKPPLRQVEQFFKASWRGVGKRNKSWSRFREIPQYIETETNERGVSPQVIISELELLRVPALGTALKGLNSFSKDVQKMREKKILDKITQPVSNSESCHSRIPDGVQNTEVTDGKLKRKPIEVRRHPAVKRVKKS